MMVDLRRFIVKGAAVMAMALLLAGCSAAGPTTRPAAVQGDEQLRELATTLVRRGLHYPELAAVRAQAVEACEDTLGSDAPLLIREALSDEQPAVRFAACMALGRLKDTESLPRLRERLEDADPSVRAGVYFALERMGDLSHRVQWRDLLRTHEDPVVRRNAALALGRLGEKKVIPLLDVAANQDKDEGVRLQALEGLATLGQREAINQMLQDAIAGAGGRQVFALLTLSRVNDSRVAPALRARLASSAYLEAQLAAARSLARQGSPEGYKLALASLTWDRALPNVPDDLPENQIMRVQSMAAMALGEIGDRRALPALSRRMQTPDDPRVQLAAATAVLMILNRAS